MLLVKGFRIVWENSVFLSVSESIDAMSLRKQRASREHGCRSRCAWPKCTGFLIASMQSAYCIYEKSTQHSCILTWAAYNFPMLKTGDKAPAWSGSDQDGVERSSDAYKGKWLLLYFYPKDDTPGCTTEACGLRDHFGKLQHRIAIVGVSADSILSHEKFAKKHRLPFTLIADTGRRIIKAFGANGMIMPKRISFLIRPDGMIEKIYPSVDCAKHAEEIDKDLDALGA